MPFAYSGPGHVRLLGFDSQNTILITLQGQKLGLFLDVVAGIVVIVVGDVVTYTI